MVHEVTLMREEGLEMQGGVEQRREVGNDKLST